MPFSYTATNSEGKKLTGIINAASRDDAKQQLNLLGLSILEIKTIESAPSATKLTGTRHQKLNSGHGQNGKQIKGDSAKAPLLPTNAWLRNIISPSNLGPLLQTAALTDQKPVRSGTPRNKNRNAGDWEAFGGPRLSYGKGTLIKTD